MAINRIAHNSVTLRDARGHIGKVGFYYGLDTSHADAVDVADQACSLLFTAIHNMSNATPIRFTGINSHLVEPNQYGANAEYPNAEDKARLIYLFVDDDISPTTFGYVRFEIPAPKLTLFLADGETINPAAALVTAFTNQLLTVDADGGVVVTAQGSIPSAFVGGFRIRRRFQRKITIWDKSANLDEPEEG